MAESVISIERNCREVLQRRLKLNALQSRAFIDLLSAEERNQILRLDLLASERRSREHDVTDQIIRLIITSRTARLNAEYFRSLEEIDGLASDLRSLAGLRVA